MSSEIAPSSLESLVQKLGRSLLADLRRQMPHRAADWLSDRLMALTTSNDRLKVELFRFVDALPALQTPADVARHLCEYLDQPGVRLPAGAKPALRWMTRSRWTERALAAACQLGAKLMARRFIAGANAAEAAGVVETLRRQNLGFTLDLLGEFVTSPADADRYQRQYLDLIREMSNRARRWPGKPRLDDSPFGPIPRVNVSVKLSALYAGFDPLAADHTAAAVKDRLRPILSLARETGCYIHVDMEQHDYRGITRRIFDEILMEDAYRDWPHVGIVVQAYLRDSADDLERLIAWSKQRGTPVWVRLVKGAYWDYETILAAQRGLPSPVFAHKSETDANFERLTTTLIRHWPTLRPAIATHNVRSAAHAMAVAASLNLPPRLVEYQVLLGMGGPIARALARRGQRVRVYTPFGQLLPGMAYLVRRLLENTSNDSFIRHLGGHEDIGQLLAPPGRPDSAGRSNSNDRNSPKRADRATLDPISSTRRTHGQNDLDDPLARSTTLGSSQYAATELADSSNAESLSSGVDVHRNSESPSISDTSAISTEESATPGAASEHNSPSCGGPSDSSAGPLRTEVPMIYPTPRPAFRNEPETDFSLELNQQAMRSAVAIVRDHLGKVVPVVIDGREEISQNLVSRPDPSDTARTASRVHYASKEQAERAIASAEAAFAGWRDTPVADRAAVLLRVAAYFRERRFHIAAWQVFEVGKPWREADADVAEAIDFCTYYAAQMQRMAQPQTRNVPGEWNEYHYEPRGVTTVIAPWNFPLAILTGMTAAALVAGNTVVIKPAEQSSRVGYFLMEALIAADLPRGVANFLPGDGEVIGPVLVNDPRVATIAFTGSRAVGLSILRDAALVQPGQRHVKRVICEMGGKNAILIDDDADLDEAVVGVLASATGYAGQKCSACSRVIVIGSAYEPFVAKLKEAIESLRIGPADDPATTVGPVVDADARDRVLKYIAMGEAACAATPGGDIGVAAPGGETRTTAFGGEAHTVEPREEVGVAALRHRGTVLTPPPALAERGYFVPVALFEMADPQHALCQEEIFGPVLAVLRAADLSAALAIADDSPYALTGGFYSRSPVNIARVRKELRVGNLYINRKITGALVDRQPFGGSRLSGVGAKAGGPDYLLQFLSPRTITESVMRRGFAPTDDRGPIT